MIPIYIGLLHAGLEALRSQQAAAMLQATHHRVAQEQVEMMAHARGDVIDVDARFIDEPPALQLDDKLCTP